MIHDYKTERKMKFLHLRYFLLFAFLISLIISILDSLIDYLFFFDEELGNVIVPSAYSHELYHKVMMIITFLIFGAILYYFLRKRFSDQQSIIDSELRFRTVANYTKDWEYWISQDKKINFISPSCKDITGYSEEEFYNNPNLINEIIFDQDKDLFLKHEEEALLGNDVESIEFRIVKKNNDIIWIDHSCQSVYDFKNKYIGHRVSNRNITSRKKIEEQLRESSKKLKISNKLLKRKVDLSYIELEAIISQSPYAKAIFDKDGKTISVNEAWSRLFRKEKPFENVLDITHISNEYLRENIANVLKEGGTFKSEPVYFEHLDRILQITVYNINNLNGEIEKIICNYEDVSDQIRRLDSDKELELQRTVSKKLFQFLEDERKHISKDLHDQIGQKLMLIKLNTELLKENVPETKEKADEIIKLVLSTTREIKDIIFSLHPAELENYGLVPALDSMINRCGKISKFKALINIYGDYLPLEKNRELAIYRICQEIVSNIAKHSKATEANFNFHFEEDRFVGIISDNGKGFNIQEFRKNKNAPRSFGMISIQERAKNLNGTLEFESKVGEGTKVYFQIPLKEKSNA
jgi:PAS domain S-box-containing protein